MPERPDTLLTIGVFARRCAPLDEGAAALRPAGIILDSRPMSIPENGYRRCRESQLATARTIVMLRRLDMPLTDAGGDHLGAGPQSRRAARRIRDACERRVAGQRELAAHLCGKLSRDARTRSACPMLARERRARALVLVEQRHVPVEELPGWIGASMTRLIATAHAHGGIAGFPFVIYYGEVNEDSDGPAEACVPIADRRGGSERRLTQPA